MKTLFTKILISGLFIGSISKSHAKSPSISVQESDSLIIESANGTEAELKTVTRLYDLVDKYNLSSFCYTKKILIKEGAIGFSHPILTLNTRDESEEIFLANFLHEQMHWYVMMPNMIDSSRSIFTKLIERFPNPVIEFPYGGGDTLSTYLHLLVNYMEFQALEVVIGKPKTFEVFEERKKRFYRWIYQAVLDDLVWFEEITKQSGLILSK